MKTEEILQKLIHSKDINKIDFNKINYDELIRIGSKHLILPLIYTSLKKNNILTKTPVEFQNYLMYIHEINYNRNKELIKEVKIISKTFEENNIKYVFLKGAAGLISNIYENIGDRMVGDIDILILKSQIDKAHKLMVKDGYKPLVDKIFFKKYNRHLVRQVNPKKLFAIELHKNLLKFKVKNCSEDEFFKNIKKIE